MISRQIFDSRFTECIKKVINIRNLGKQYSAFEFEDGAIKVSGSNNSYMESSKKLYITQDTRVSDFFYSWSEILFSINNYNKSYHKEFQASEDKFSLKPDVITELKKMYKNDVKLGDINEVLYIDYYKTNYELYNKDI